MKRTWLIAACMFLMFAVFSGTSHAAAPAGFIGWGTVTTSSGGMIPAWSWNAAASTWSAAPVASGSDVYLYPWTSSWAWTWTQASGWRAVHQSYVFAHGTTTTVFIDDFSGSPGAYADAARWKYESGPYGYARDACFAKNNAVTNGAGQFVITGRKESIAGCSRAYTAGSVETPQTFGPPEPGQIITMEARIKAPCGSGQWPAFWTTGVADSWPAHGEIDMVEIYGNDPFVAAHDQHASTTAGGRWHKQHPIRSGSAWCNSFHVFGVRWSTGRLDYMIDGSITASISRSVTQTGQIWAWDSYAQQLKLNLALGSDAGTVDETRLPSQMLVDYVRVTSN